jgi:hypothetical protein
MRKTSPVITGRISSYKRNLPDAFQIFLYIRGNFPPIFWWSRLCPETSVKLYAHESGFWREKECVSNTCEAVNRLEVCGASSLQNLSSKPQIPLGTLHTLQYMTYIFIQICNIILSICDFCIFLTCARAILHRVKSFIFKCGGRILKIMYFIKKFRTYLSVFFFKLLHNWYRSVLERLFGTWLGW